MITKSGTNLAQAPMVLQPHQQRVVDRLDKDPGLVAYHSLGSGKTLTSLIAAQRALKANQAAGHHDQALFIVPASLQDNMWKEVAKHRLNIPRDQMRVMTYDKAVRELPELQKHRYAITVADEAHKLRNQGTSRLQAMKQIAARSDRRLLLTGSLAYHQPSDIAPLVNMAANTRILPETPEDFNAKYLRERTHRPGFIKRLMGEKKFNYTELQNTDKLVGNIKHYVDRHNSLSVNPHDFPSVTHNRVEVEMDRPQAKMYDYMQGKMPKLLAYKIRMGLPLDKRESANLNAFAGAIRQVSDSTVPYDKTSVTSPKLNSAVQALRAKMHADPNFRGIVYSNYLPAALDPYAQQLDHYKVPYQKFTGSITQAKKKAMVEDFNSMTPSARVLLLSSSGGEGLDLKGVKYEQILEPHWNQEKINQVVGRGVRFKSHNHLPEAERHVDVDHFMSVKPKSLMQKWFKTKRPQSIDEYMSNLSQQKDGLIGTIRDSLEQESTQR